MESENKGKWGIYLLTEASTESRIGSEAKPRASSLTLSISDFYCARRWYPQEYIMAFGPKVCPLANSNKYCLHLKKPCQVGIYNVFLQKSVLNFNRANEKKVRLLQKTPDDMPAGKYLVLKMTKKNDSSNFL